MAEMQAQSPLEVVRRRLRRRAVVRRIGLSWRGLTGGTARGGDGERRTLVACSGGGDSSGLAIALWAAAARPDVSLVMAHVVHDMRPAAEALADRDQTRQLAGLLALTFVEAAVTVRGGVRNAEAAARAARYAALAELAGRHGCTWVATGHHEGDQLESVLMALVRGAGPRGLGAIAPSRRLAGGVRVIRPGLEVSRDDLVALCADVGWRPVVDATNGDLSRLRAAVRAGPAAQLLALRPAAGRRAVLAAELQRSAARMVESAAAELAESGVSDAGYVWPRDALRGRPMVVVAELARELARRVAGRGEGRVPSQRVAVAMARCVLSAAVEPREFQCGGWVFEVRSQRVEARLAEPIRSET